MCGTNNRQGFLDAVKFERDLQGTRCKGAVSPNRNSIADSGVGLSHDAQAAAHKYTIKRQEDEWFEKCEKQACPAGKWKETGLEKSGNLFSVAMNTYARRRGELLNASHGDAA